MVRFIVHPPGATEFESFSLSPSGHHVAFTAAGQLWVKGLDSLEATRINDTQGAHDPFWSPDSRSIAYFKSNSLWVVGIAGGESRVVCPAWNAMGGSWSSAGVILFAADFGQAIYRVPASGGDRSPVRVQGKHGYDLRWPSFVAGTDAFLYSARPTERGARTLYVGRLSVDDDRALLETDANAEVASGRLLFVRQGQLFTQSFNVRSLGLEGAVAPVAGRLLSNLYRRIDYANFSAAASPGVPMLAYLGTRQVDRELRLVGRDGSDQLLIGPGEYRDLAVSPDGTQLAFEQLDEVSGTRDIWTMDLTRRQPVRVTSDSHDDLAPVWSSDGKALYYASNRGGEPGIYRRPADDSGDEERLMRDLGHAVPYDVSPDGGRLVFIRAHQRRDLDLWLMRLIPPYAETAYRTSPWRESEPRFSPDGRWLAYSTTDTGDRHVYIERVDQPGPRWQISVKNGREPFWRHDMAENLLSRSRPDADGRRRQSDPRHAGHRCSQAGRPTPVPGMGRALPLRRAARRQALHHERPHRRVGPATNGVRPQLVERPAVDGGNGGNGGNGENGLTQRSGATENHFLGSSPFLRSSELNRLLRSLRSLRSCPQRPSVGRASMPVRRLLVGVRDAENAFLVERASDDLETDRGPAAIMPQGTLTAGRPARFALTVNTSARYICSGSSIFSPSLKAGVGQVGIATTSTWPKARSKSRAMSVRTCCALR